MALPIRGTGDLKTELASDGTDFSQLTGNLSGTLKVEAKDGAVPVDFARLAAGSTPISTEGWSRDGVTAFDQLDADCKLGSGHIWCQSLSMQTSQGSIAGSGDIDLTKQTIDWNLTVANRNRAGKDLATDARRGAQGFDPRIAGAADHPQGGPPDAWRGQLADEPGGTAGFATLTWRRMFRQT